jgi:tetratricopeptide (TPR) repeat protein
VSARTVRAPAHRPAPNAARLAVALVLAVAGPAAGAQPVAVASGAGPAARDVAPAGRSARDSAMTTARTFARAGAIDAAIRAYEAWLAAEPDDAAAWRDLAVQRRRAGRMREGIAALERAQALDPDDGTGRRIRQWRAAAAASVEPEVVGTRDSDGNVTRRAGLAVGLADRARLRVTASARARRADDGLAAAALDEGRLAAVWRPRAALRVELAGGAARTGYRVADTAAAAGRRPRAGARRRGRAAPGAGVSTVRGEHRPAGARARAVGAA